MRSWMRSRSPTCPNRCPSTVRNFRTATLVGKSELQFEPAIARVLAEAFTVRAAGNLVGPSEQRRRDVSDDRARVVMVQQVPDRHPQRKVVAAGGGYVLARNTAS